MSTFTYDELWKGVIEVYFEAFMFFFYEEVCEEIDFTKGCEFLDKELQKLYPPSATSNRRADKLLKFWKKSGEEEHLILHVEVQGYDDNEIPERVFNIYYRLFDRYKKSPAVLVIYTNDNSNYHPQQFRLQALDTMMTFNFGTYKLSEHHPETYPKGNLFSYVMETAWFNLKRNKLSDDELLEYKTGVVQKMKKDGHSLATIYNLLRFMVYYTRFEKTEYFDKFEDNIQVILKNDKHMSIFEMEKKKIAEESEMKGKMKGKLEGINLTLEVMKLLKQNWTTSDIAQKLGISQNEVVEIKTKIENL